jgi:hypothetical protein
MPAVTAIAIEMMASVLIFCPSESQGNSTQSKAPRGLGRVLMNRVRWMRLARATSAATFSTSRHEVKLICLSIKNQIKFARQAQAASSGGGVLQTLMST